MQNAVDWSGKTAKTSAGGVAGGETGGVEKQLVILGCKSIINGLEVLKRLGKECLKNSFFLLQKEAKPGMEAAEK
jgi:hypothetical protein